VSGPNWDIPEPTEPPDRGVAFYQRVAADHANDPDTGRCSRCGVRRCLVYCDAVLRLATAGYRVDEAT
jgi:hypothetical protein